MSFTTPQKEALAAPLDRSVVKERKQGSAKVSYVEAWHAIAEANRIFGFDGWTRETVVMLETNRELLTLKSDDGPYQQWRVGYMAKVRVQAGGVTREGTGFGSGIANQNALSDAIESAVKEAESDAMKRALMTFGNPFGLALYDKEKANVADPPPPPSALDVGKQQLIGATSAEDFKAIWAKLQAGASNVMSKGEYAQLVDFMKHEAKRWAPPRAEPPPAEPKSEPAREERAFAMSEDEIPF